jgi:hypothetical protein
MRERNTVADSPIFIFKTCLVGESQALLHGVDAEALGEERDNIG